MSAPRGPILAIGLDAAERSLVRRLAAEGRLPAMARLMATGRWGAVRSPADIGSGAVWPTFSTGTPPERHGVFGEHAWDAGTMRLRRSTFDAVAPFWSDLAAAGRRVAIVDVPFAPIVGHANLIEIADWGAHDWFGGAPVIRPQVIEQVLAAHLQPRHPLTAGRVDSNGPTDAEGLAHVVDSLLEGVHRRGALAARLLDTSPLDLLLVVFTEIHRASHLLWHTLDASHPAWRDEPASLPPHVMHGLIAIFEAVDAQIGRLVERAGPGTPIVVFALHGMQPARGIPAFLDDVLEAWGFAARRRWWHRSPRELAGAAIKGVKTRIPVGLKTLYYQRVSKSVTMRLAQPATPVPAWDWRRTRAFSLPTDQHGWIRVNLAGREAQGTVAAADYAALCGELRDALLSLSSLDGPLVQDVIVTAEAAGAPPRLLPDLVVHWTPATWRARVDLVDPPLRTAPIGLKFVGQHRDDGFYVGAGGGIDDWPDAVEATTLSQRLTDALRRE